MQQMKKLFTQFLMAVGASIALAADAAITKHAVLPVANFAQQPVALPQARQSLASRLVCFGRQHKQHLINAAKNITRKQLLIGGALGVSAALCWKYVFSIKSSPMKLKVVENGYTEKDLHDEGLYQFSITCESTITKLNNLYPEASNEFAMQKRPNALHESLTSAEGQKNKAKSLCLADKISEVMQAHKLGDDLELQSYDPNTDFKQTIQLNGYLTGREAKELKRYFEQTRFHKLQFTPLRNWENLGVVDFGVMPELPINKFKYLAVSPSSTPVYSMKTLQTSAIWANSENVLAFFDDLQTTLRSVGAIAWKNRQPKFEFTKITMNIVKPAETRSSQAT